MARAQAIWLLAVAGAFFALDSFFKRFDAGWGWLRVAALGAVFAGVAIAQRSLGRARLGEVAQARRARTLGFAVGLLALASVLGGAFLGLEALRRGPLTDQSQNTVGAVHAVLAGRNPYALELDPDTANLQAASGQVDTRWLGYKYGPGTILAFAPLVLAFGETGVVLTDALAMALIAVALVLLLRRRGASLHLAVALAALPFAARYMASVTRYGETDPPAVALALFGLWAVERGSLTAAGALIAASCAAKLLPGAIYVIALWPLLMRPRFAAGFFAVAIAFALPLLLADAGAAVRSLVVFPITRAPDSTGLPFFVPPSLRWMLAALGATALAGVAYRALRARERPLTNILWGHLAVLAVGNYFHNNYLIWVYPLLGLAVGEQLLAPRESGAALRTSR